MSTASVAVGDLSEVWTHVFDKDGVFGSITVASDGRIYWAGRYGRIREAAPPPSYLMGFKGNGKRAWQKKLPADLIATVIAATPDANDVVVLGIEAGRGTSWFGRYRGRNGRQDLWKRTQLGTVVRAAVVADDGNVYAAGRVTVLGGNPRNDDILVVKLTPAGDVVWSERFDATPADEASTIAIDPRDGGVIVGGRTGPVAFPPPEDTDAIVLKYSAEGQLHWVTTLDRDGAGESVTGLSVSPNGKKVFIAGTSASDPGDNTTSRWYFQQLNARNGAAKPPKLLSVVAGAGETLDAMNGAADGKALFLGGMSCGVVPPIGCDTYVVRTNNRGKIQERMPIEMEGQLGGYLGVAAIGVDPDGDIVLGGRAGGQGVYLRKIRP